jgi:DNA-binding transcriptional ArsR family regulator
MPRPASRRRLVAPIQPALPELLVSHGGRVPSDIARFLTRYCWVSINLPLVAANHSSVEALAALADPTRRAIFERLAQRPCAVGELARELPVSRPAVSQHLKVLKQAGLVADTPVGTRRVYRVNPDGLGALRAYLDRFWNRALLAYKDAAERPTREVS